MKTTLIILAIIIIAILAVGLFILWISIKLKDPNMINYQRREINKIK